MRDYRLNLSVLISGFVVAACNPASHAEYRHCLLVKPGMTEQEVVDKMGAAQNRELDGNALWLYYRQEPDASGPIGVLLSDQGGTYRVQQTACEGLG